MNDDGSELAPDPPLIRGHACLSGSGSVTVLDLGTWSAIEALSPSYEAPAYDTLLLDAKAVLPQVGPAVVLAMTAIEVRIGTALNTLASERIDAKLWDWITDRGDYRKDPSTEERLSVLMDVLGGGSLKERKDLWDAFVTLRKARNRFAHEGRLLVDAAEAAALIGKAELIVDWIEEMLPPEGRRPRAPAGAPFNLKFVASLGSSS
jgi:hypothetical protein